MKNRKQIFISFIIFSFLILFDGRYQLSHCESKRIHAPADKQHFELNVNVLPEIVEIKIKNLSGPMELDENVVIERWDNIKKKWLFAACPLWFCATKETVFRRKIKAGEISIIKWRKNLHQNCEKAKASKYQVLIKDYYNGKLLATPVEFIISQ